jgi:hypothetical protein
VVISIRQREQLFVTAVFLDQPGDVIPTRPPALAHSIRSTSSLPIRSLETDHPCVRLLHHRMKIIHPAKPDPTIK